jgi:hypothetical protein
MGIGLTAKDLLDKQYYYRSIGLTAKGLIDKRHHYNRVYDRFCTDEEIYKNIKYFYSYPAGADDLGIVPNYQRGDLVHCLKGVGKHTHYLTIEFSFEERIPVFFANYHTWIRCGKIDKLLY